jgi:hypothetical protein
MVGSKKVCMRTVQIVKLTFFPLYLWTDAKNADSFQKYHKFKKKNSELPTLWINAKFSNLSLQKSLWIWEVKFFNWA